MQCPRATESLGDALNTQRYGSAAKARRAVPADVQRATLRVAALGLYECELNGTVVGDLVLAPGWTDYAKRVYVQDHDVTDQLQAGENVIGLVLGDGWYCGRIADNDRQLYGRQPQFLLELMLETAAGRMSRVVSDSSWRVAVGPLLENDLIMGEDYDARLEWPGWSRAGFDDAAWQAAPLAAAGDFRAGQSRGAPTPAGRPGVRLSAGFRSEHERADSVDGAGGRGASA